MANIGNKEVMSKNIRFYVEKINKDRREICKDLNVSYSTFSDWYNGNKYPRIDKIEAMADFLKYFEKLSKKVLTKRHF